VAYFGDGATSKGDFHEAMNFAGVFKNPTIFFCQNNQFAIPSEKNTDGIQTIARRRSPMEWMDSGGWNDLFAVFTANKRSSGKSRSGKGSTLIEGVTYRWTSHHCRRSNQIPDRERD